MVPSPLRLTVLTGLMQTSGGPPSAWEHEVLPTPLRAGRKAAASGAAGQV